MIAPNEDGGGLDLVHEIHTSLGCTEEATLEFIRALLVNIKLFDEKQHDYGSQNVADYGTFGQIVRANDKFRRLQSLFNKKRRPKVQESITNSMRDIANHMTIAVMIENHKWPQ